MEIIYFEIVGKFAHFRRFYSNSSALSFSIPPRTTIMGIIAAFLGKERDSYYTAFSSDNILIGIGVGAKLKKNFHRMNLLSIKSASNFRGNGGRTQIPVEVITGEDLKKDEVVYRIYLSYTDNGKAVFTEIKERFLRSEQQYSISLGLANFSASIRNVKLYKGSTITKREVSREEIEFHSALNADCVEKLLIDEETYNLIEEDLLPADFKADNDREVVKMNRLLFLMGIGVLKVKFTGTFYQLKDVTGLKNIQFLT